MLVGRAYEARSARERLVMTATCGGLGLLPDLDVAGVALGLADHGLYGHRGYSHSLLFATSVAMLGWICARRWGTRPLFTAVLAFLAVASHGILDAMTYRTRGIPFFWPFSEMRVAFPWRPIPPAPTGVAFLSLRGVEVIAVELVYFAPLTLLACSPSLAWWRRRCARLAFWRRRVGTLPAASAVALLPPAPAPFFSPRRPVFRVAGAVTAVAISLIAAQIYLRRSRLVAWIEQSTEESVAVSMAARRSGPHRLVH